MFYSFRICRFVPMHNRYTHKSFVLQSNNYIYIDLDNSIPLPNVKTTKGEK
jgi:hypothetical protein